MSEHKLKIRNQPATEDYPETTIVACVNHDEQPADSGEDCDKCVPFTGQHVWSCPNRSPDSSDAKPSDGLICANCIKGDHSRHRRSLCQNRTGSNNVHCECPYNPNEHCPPCVNSNVCQEQDYCMVKGKPADSGEKCPTCPHPIGHHFNEGDGSDLWCQTCGTGVRCFPCPSPDSSDAKPSDDLIEQAREYVAAFDWDSFATKRDSDKFETTRIGLITDLASFARQAIAAADRIKRAEESVVKESLTTPDDLIAAADKFIHELRSRGEEPDGQWSKVMASFAQTILKSREGKVIDEFEKRLFALAEQWNDETTESVKIAARTVREEMKQNERRNLSDQP